MPEKKIINVEDLWAEFGGRNVLSGVNLSSYKNQITVILGGSGSGKTTVLKHLIGLYPIQKGSIEVFESNLQHLDENERNQFFLKMGVFYQNGALINSLTVSENVALPLEQHTNLPDEIIKELVQLKLKLVNLEHARNLYPVELSGGMRKRAGIARAIAMDPPLLFCDEPGAGLDPVLLASLDNLILRLRDQLGISIVLVTHEVASIFRLADRIVFLEQGQVLFEGSLQDTLSAGIPSIDEFFNKGKGNKNN